MFLLFDWLQLQIALESRFVCVLGNKVPAIIRRRVEHLHLLPHGDFAVIVDTGLAGLLSGAWLAGAVLLCRTAAQRARAVHPLLFCTERDRSG